MVHLTNDQKEITPETKRVLMKAQEQGIRLVIASGRPAKGIEKYGKMLEMDKHHGLFLCFNGAKVIDCQTGEVPSEYNDGAGVSNEDTATFETI